MPNFYRSEKNMGTINRYLTVLVMLYATTAMAAATKNITVTWTVSDDSNIQEFRLYYDTDSTMRNKILVQNCSTPAKDPTNTYSMSCSDVSLEGQEVYFSVAAVIDGNETFSPLFKKQIVATISPVQEFKLAIGDSGTSGTANALINFQPANSEVPDGYRVDSGEAFTSTKGYGWVQSPGSVGTRDRNSTNSANQADDTLIHVDPSGVWEYELPNGNYSVTVRVGDPVAPDTQNTVVAEGVPLLQNAAISSDTPWQTGSGTVTVEDGRLTLRFTGSSPYAKLCWITIN